MTIIRGQEYRVFDVRANNWKIAELRRQISKLEYGITHACDLFDEEGTCQCLLILEVQIPELKEKKAEAQRKLRELLAVQP